MTPVVIVLVALAWIALDVLIWAFVASCAKMEEVAHPTTQHEGNRDGQNKHENVV